ncbi:MAG: hypothetical protein QM691_14490 [Opitutaceae bacterium]
MLKQLFVWLDAHPAAHNTGLTITLALLLLWVARAVRARPVTASPLRGGAWMFAALILLALLASRWPMLLQTTPFNPDEAQMIAAALTYAQDPAPFRSVDLTTSGPLNGLMLLPTHWLGVPQDYFNARLVAVLLEWGTLLALFGTLRKSAGTAVAALALIPGVLTFATMVDSDLIHYTSEHLPVFLWSLAVWLLARCSPVETSANVGPGASWYAGGVLLGLMPWAKLQSAPLGAALGVSALLVCWLDRRRSVRSRRTWIVGLCGAALLPTIVILGLAAATGQFGQFQVCYLQDNLEYMGTGLSWSTVLAQLGRISSITWQVPAFAGATLLLALGHLHRALVRGSRPAPLFWVATVSTLAALYAVVAPRHSFFHYILLLLAPLTLLAATVIVGLWNGYPTSRGRRLLVASILLLGGVGASALRLRCEAPANLRTLAHDWRAPHSVISRHIRQVARPGDRLTIWGWWPHLHVETALPQGTRDAHTFRQMEPSPRRDTFYRPRFLADLQAHRPTFFVDAVGPTSFGFHDREGNAHETFPELREFVARHYVFVKDFMFARLYMRRDLAAERHTRLPLVVPLTLAGFSVTEAVGEVSRLGDAPPAPPYEGRYEDGRNFGDLTPLPALDLFAHAPSRLVHPLPPGTLHLRGAGAFRDAAFSNPAAATDGATFAVRWIAADGSRTLAWERRLDPAANHVDRAPAAFDLATPADATAVEFTIEPGASNSFDWTYWHDLRFDVRYCP